MSVMSAQREVEGLPWPDGDPGGLRAIATRANSIATELDGRRRPLAGLNPVGWLGEGRDSFTIALVEHAHALGAGAAAMRQAAGALVSLAQTIEHAQHTVLDAARKLKAARDAGTQAQGHAEQLRAEANRQRGVDLFTSLAVPFPAGHSLAYQQADAAATLAENKAVAAQGHALEVEAWAQRQASDAVQGVQRADSSCASELERIGLVQMPNSSALVCPAVQPSQPLSALGDLLLGSASATNGTLLGFLSAPPPPPPPPPKPVHKTHHSFWSGVAAVGMGVVTVGLTAVDAAQLGLDPVTDGATVAAGGETAALADEALTAGVATDEAATAGATAATESASELVATEGDPAAGLAVREGAVDAPVEDPSLPSARPSWRDSEQSVGSSYREQGYREQVSFKDGEEVPYGTKGSTRPELYKPSSSVEVKNYDVTTPQGRSNLVRNVVNQAVRRDANVPQGTTQSVVIDVRGQSVSPETLDAVASRIASRSGGVINMDDIVFLR